jgi:dolichol-phosphate mannosyltransferase
MQHILPHDFAPALVQQPLELSVVVPVMNEHDNVPELIRRLVMALAGIEWEVIFVDDGSTDGTQELVADIARDDRRVRLLQRIGRRGLSSAVIEGMLASTAPVLAVIDGDLQHDETLLPTLFQAVRAGKDLAVGTRYANGGSVGDWSSSRAWISVQASRLAGLVTRTPLSDPMSGFFAVSRTRLVELAPRLSGIGYKILLDIAASSPTPLAVAEFPYTFRNRQAGESKLDSLVALQYFEMLVEKRLGRWIPLSFIKFSCVGALGLLFHLATLGLLIRAGAPFDAAQGVAVIGAMTFNFFLNNRFTYSNRRLTGYRLIGGLLSFYLVCGLGAVANVGVGSIVYNDGNDWVLAGVAGAIVGCVWNYVMGGLLTWRKRT